MRAIVVAALLLACLPRANAAERVWHRLPEGFHGTNPILTERLVSRTWVPAGQDDATWTQAFTVQSFPGMARSAAELAAAFEDASRARCTEEPRVRDLGDMATALQVLWFRQCRTAGGVEASVVHVLEGRDGDHIVSLDFDHAPSSDELERLLPFVREARVCDDADPERACPAGGVAPIFVRVIRSGVE